LAKAPIKHDDDEDELDKEFEAIVKKQNDREKARLPLPPQAVLGVRSSSTTNNPSI